jgi:hypothetical protein
MLHFDPAGGDAGRKYAASGGIFRNIASRRLPKRGDPFMPTPPTPTTSQALPDAALTDERERREAATSAQALVRYQDKWARRITRLQRAHPERWRVAGWSDEEVRDSLTLRLIEAVLAPSDESTPASPSPAPGGKEWGLRVIERNLAFLRKTFRLRTRVMDLRNAALPGQAPTEEERWLEREEEATRSLAEREAETHLSRPQKRWLAAMKLAARGGAFFRASAAPNLSAASRLLGKNRSSGQRAFRELQSRFDRERRRFD